MAQKNEDINLLAFNYSQSVSSAVRDVANPFLTKFGLTTFIYGRLFYDGRYMFLGTEPNWVKNWYQNITSISGTSLHSFFKEVPLDGKAYYALWSMVPQDYLVRLNNRFGLWHGFDIYLRLEDSIEGWSFSTTKERDHMSRFYLNNVNLFHGFFLFFREKAPSLLDTQDKKKLAVFNEIADFTFKPADTSRGEIELFLSSLFDEGYTLPIKNGSIHLSKRELDCMFYLSQGKTSKEIARILDISHRTVDTHLKHIKQKSGFLDTSSLLDAYRDNILKWL